MKITKIITAFMVAGLIGTVGCDSKTPEPAGGPDPMETGSDMEAEMGDMPDPGEEEAPAAEEEAPAAEEEAAAPAAEEEAAAPAPKSDE
jgi:hypothetical protein